MHQIQLSSYGQKSALPAPVSAMMADFDRNFRDNIDINLGVGYVNNDTIPAEHILSALKHVLENPTQYRSALNYGGPAGSCNLINAIRNYYAANNITGLNHDLLSRKNILIGASGATSILEAMADVTPPGLVITSDPIYYIFCDLLERRDFSLLAIPEDNQGFNTDIFQQKLDQFSEKQLQSIRFFYIVTVNNPTCTILSNQRRKQLVDIANQLSNRLGRTIPLVMDTAYEHLIHNPQVEPVQSTLIYDTQNLVYQIGSLSKILAPALRIGYLISPPSDLTRAITQKTGDIGFSAPVINQQIAARLLENHAEKQVAEVNNAYRHKATQTKKWIQQYLGKHMLQIQGGDAGFYFYITLKEIQTHQQSPFFRYLTRQTNNAAIDGPAGDPLPRIIYIPGQFCVHSQGDLKNEGQHSLRISYAFESLSKIEKALQYMGDAAAYAAGQP